MDDLLAPDTLAGQRSNDAPEEMAEPSCCSPIRSKLKTSRIKLFSVIHIVCGSLSIGLGIVACILGCMYNGLSIVAGVAFIATGVVGMCVRKHGAMVVVFGFLSAASCLWSITMLMCMLTALAEREGTWKDTCSSYDCRTHWYHDDDDNCCEAYKFVFTWENVAIDLAILVVGVVELVASLLATTLISSDTNWIKICCLKKNMGGLPFVSDTIQTTRVFSSDERSALSGQSPAMKRCWKPCEGKGHRNATIVLSVIHIITGVVSIALGIAAVFFESRYAHIGIPIWSGLLIFVVTGIYGLLSATKKGSYIFCFSSLSILALLLSINMYCWAANNIHEDDYYHHYKYGCVDWSCHTTTSIYYHYSCDDCLPGCCSMGDIGNKAESIRVLVDVLTVGFGVLEMLICIATFGLSFSQISCYVCCRNSSCCQPNMVMTSDDNLMMVAVPNTHSIPTIVHNQPMMVQHQPTMIPDQLILAQNQPTVAQGSPSQGTSQTSGARDLPQPQLQGHGAQKPVIFQAQRQPMLVQGHGQLMMVGGQGQPMLVQGQAQSMLVQAQGQPMMDTARSRTTNNSTTNVCSWYGASSYGSKPGTTNQPASDGSCTPGTTSSYHDPSSGTKSSTTDTMYWRTC